MFSYRMYFNGLLMKCNASLKLNLQQRLSYCLFIQKPLREFALLDACMQLIISLFIMPYSCKILNIFFLHYTFLICKNQKQPGPLSALAHTREHFQSFVHSTNEISL